MRTAVPAPASTSSLPDYAELYCLSNFTFLHGASHAEELVARAVQLGYSALAITDECSLAGVVRAHAEAKKAALPLIIGAHFHLHHDDGSAALSLILLASNRNGYGNLAELITLARTRTAKGTYLLTPADLAAPAPAQAHLAGMPDCLAILLPAYPGHDAADLDRLHTQAAWMAATFPGRAWLGLNLLHRAFDEAHRATVEEVAWQHGLAVVALGHVCMHVRSRKPLHDTLCAIRLNTPVAECGYALAQNAEQHLRARLRLANLYSPDALAETLRIARLCSFSLDQLRYEYPDELVPPGQTPSGYLRAETYIGAHHRFPLGIPAKVQEQLETELQLIGELRYEPYFLTVYDIVRHARSIGILCQGRGSAANSAVCYCLGITEVDPARGNLLFGRFISKERDEPPDIDVDFEHQRREEVIQYIYNKYGRDRAALAAVVISYRPKSALRDSGKALGVDLAIVEKVAKTHHWFDSKDDLVKRLAECGLDPDSPLAQQWATLAQRLLGFPRHLSQHPGGFVIAAGKLSRLVPIENATMADRSVIQWDKDDLEELGLLKVDVLALGMLSVLRRAFDLVGELRGTVFSMQDIPAEDSATYDMICAADTVGVFQIESRAQMSMLPRMLPRIFYDLVVEVAVVRPGPIQGGMVHPYLRRRQGLEQPLYPKEELKAALERTLGVPIFQEQVMQVAMIAAGFTAGEADQLRRAMAAWKRKGGLEKYYDKIVNGMLERGYTLEFAESIFNQIKGFGEYGFPESHAASFALLAYASSWLKCHEPAAFLCALLNSQPMGFYSPSQLVQDARRHGIEVRAVDVAISGWDSSLEPGEGAQPAVRLGLSLQRGMRPESAARIEEARAVRAFESVADLARRAALDRHDLHVLAGANALHGLAGNRRQALWQAVGAVPDKDLLRPTTPEEDVPLLHAPSEGEDIVGDYRAQGLTLGRHPLALLRARLLEQRFLPAAQLNGFKQGQLARACGIVTVRQRPATAKGVLFVTIEDETGNVNVIVWPSLVEQQRREVLGASLLGVYGVWQSDGQVRHLVAKRLVDLSHLMGRLDTSSRDFC
ncbi:error-prone DNA polymerase [Massilia antarctica]|uniref:error-prone DNA polymerase n=1 Tax=Massilia antarctica TaxID=2765360 RepID=UPI0006BB5C8C|nr:error-prone DNA polymerase [Massilia sp. H27-R4]MCY0911486.1 error-prone DNA polymerase [Massilia sp. H27-R4]CUI04907.1 DNA polymerase III alpha subunit [Janthinobacterium sp. CG23_2]CUU28693.1 DNA polymerase III alpha subunit [Janthinobacterium sp. CG23_2]